MEKKSPVIKHFAIWKITIFQKRYINHLHTWPIFQSYLRLPEGFMSIPPSGALTLPNHVGLAGSPRSCLHWFTNEHEHSNPVWICQLCMEQKQLTIPSLPQTHQKNGVPGLYSICSNQNLLNGEHCQKSCKRQPAKCSCPENFCR